MRVVALALSYPPARRIGSELALHSLLTHLVARGHDVTVVTVEKTPPCRLDGVTVTHRQALTAPPDVVIAQGGLGERARQWWRGRPLFVWAHNNQIPTLLDLRAVLGRGATVLANTHHGADIIGSVLGAHAHVLHPPVAKTDRVTGGTALTLVNLTHAKGSDVFWDLAQANPHREFLGVKGGYGEPDVRDLPNVDVVEHGDLTDVWSRTRTLLLPSVHESYSMTAVEAATRGIPVIASPLPGVREAVGDGAIYATDWQAALERMDAEWENRSDGALMHTALLDSSAELDAVAALIEAV